MYTDVDMERETWRERHGERDFERERRRAREREREDLRYKVAAECILYLKMNRCI